MRLSWSLENWEGDSKSAGLRPLGVRLPPGTIRTLHTLWLRFPTFCLSLPSLDGGIAFCRSFWATFTFIFPENLGIGSAGSLELRRHGLPAQRLGPLEWSCEPVHRTVESLARCYRSCGELHSGWNSATAFGNSGCVLLAFSWSSRHRNHRDSGCDRKHTEQRSFRVDANRRTGCDPH